MLQCGEMGLKMQNKYQKQAPLHFVDYSAACKGRSVQVFLHHFVVLF